MTAPPKAPASVTPCARLALTVAAALWLAAVAVILIHVWLRPESNTLYKVFRAGGARWLHSENLYPKVDEYIYSPFAAAFFAPFALLPDRVAGIAWRVLSLAAYAGAFAAWLRESRAAPGERVALAWVLLLPLSLGDIFNGQANPLVIGLLMLAVLACRREQWMVAAFCVAVAAYFKVYPLAIGMLLGVAHPRRFPWRLALALAAIFGLSLILQRPAYALEQYGNWVRSLGKDPRRTLNYYGTYRDFWLLLRLLRVPVSLQGWAGLQALSGAALAAYLYLARRRGASADMVDFLLMTLGACWMLLFGPATESATYVILAPPLMLAWVRWRGEPGADGYLGGVVACYALLLASQMLSSWGHQYQNVYTHLVQPLGTMILAGTVLAYGAKARAGAEVELAAGAAVD
jgi:hypothetical protein